MQARKQGGRSRESRRDRGSVRQDKGKKSSSVRDFGDESDFASFVSSGDHMGAMREFQRHETLMFQAVPPDADALQVMSQAV